MSCGKYSVHTKMFNSFEVTSTRGLGSGHSKPVEVTLASVAGGWVAAGSVALPPPQAVINMLAMAMIASNFKTFDLLISSSLEDLCTFGNADSNISAYN